MLFRHFFLKEIEGIEISKVSEDVFLKNSRCVSYLTLVACHLLLSDYFSFSSSYQRYLKFYGTGSETK